jgi:WhiB family redox-sensing transcriptional regulator
MLEEGMTPRVRELFLDLSGQAAELGDSLPCSNAPDLFFPDKEETYTLTNMNDAKKMCLECPLIALCAEYAIEAQEDFGVWGGLSANERRSLRRRLRTSDRVLV